MKTLLFLLALVLASCKVSKGHFEETPKYFEGIIEYRIEYESLNELFPVEDMTRANPDRVILYFQEGSSMEEQFKNDTLIKRNWYNQSTNRNYYHRIDSDTLYYSDPSVSDFSVDAIQKSEGETILDHSTTKLKILSSGKKETFYEGATNKLELYTSSKLPVNPEWYQLIEEFGYNRTMKLAPGICLKTRFVIFNYNQTTRTATKIEWKDVQLDLSVDSSKVMIRI